VIQTIFKSDSEKSKSILEKFHVYNDKQFVNLIKSRGMIFLYSGDKELILTESDSNKLSIIHRKDQQRLIIDEYSESNYSYVVNSHRENKTHLLDQFKNG
jgi:hypothetical protein